MNSIPRFPAALLTVAATLMLGSTLFAQEPYVFEDEIAEWGEVVGRYGDAILVEAPGPATCTGCNRPSTQALFTRWIMVQDSTRGVVFTEPSGLKWEGFDYNGDVDLRALRGVVAVEIRALTFNVWNEFGIFASVTRIRVQEAGDDWHYDPTWSDIGAPAHEHLSSIMWVGRVMYEDGSVEEADMAPVAAAWLYLTGTELGELEAPLLGIISG